MLQLVVEKGLRTRCAARASSTSGAETLAYMSLTASPEVSDLLQQCGFE